ncbi:probable ATP-dependent RNA helicase DDX10 [Anopheles nili]|uniref:probable ATP-dependent RNA helicase DDX10 n=1 Tax=Anopheles nili TaxID=185578 RepID=UPI00237C1144|nr:probable ATP-dependent RNA helicase DDX10 [Anopheles nili]
MGKNKYVNFARKNKFKSFNVQYTNKDNGHSAEGRQNCEQDETASRAVFKFSVKDEETEITSLRQRYNNISASTTESIETFKDFPLSKKTLAGLHGAQFIKPTVIQRQSILDGLCGKDVLAAAKTGSGKTLAFIIPILERLYVEKWTRLDGLGALIITPTRELAVQIFETFAKVGKHHDFTTGLIIGGQNLKFERNRLHNLNVIIGTPGRLLQHMDQNPLFDPTNLKVLVLDEADRCLDMGFSATMNSIIENLPTLRQTLLFSATQTNSVKDLARVKLKNPVCIAPHAHEDNATPAKLQQSYVVVDLPSKLTMLWSFLRTHPKQKIIIFFATCKQVKYFYQILRKLRPLILLLPLYGGMNQEKRNKIYAEFCGKNSNVCMLATDVASRGLDFPKVNWVVQMDCPEDVVQYIHRAGRTARLNTGGENLLVLLPHEEKAMLESLRASRVPIKQIQVDERQLFSPLVKIQSLLAQSPDLKESAKRAFIAYIKSVALMKNRDIFQLQKLNLEEYAKSLGLTVTPRVRFLSRIADDRKPLDSTCSKLKNNVEIWREVSDSDADSDGESFLKIKRINHTSDWQKTTQDEGQFVKLESSEEQPSVVASKKRISKAKLIKKSLTISKRTMFDEEGVPLDADEQHLHDSYDINAARLKLEQQDIHDKIRYKSLKKEKRNELKEKERKRSVSNKTNDPQDDFGSESDTSINLDWLPDPDKIYGEQSSSANVEEKRKQVDIGDIKKMYQPPTKRKRMLLQKTNELSLNETERLAMHLLE